MQIVEHHDEFITPESGQRVGLTHGLEHALGHLAEQVVAYFMAQGVVDVLEVVQSMNRTAPLRRLRWAPATA
jgi:hypothetical protein